MLGIIAGCFQCSHVYADDVTQKTPPEKVNITVHKLMYDQGTQLNVDIDGIKNDGYFRKWLCDRFYREQWPSK